MDSLPLGTVIGGRFQIDTLIGMGGLGQVYKAMDNKASKSVAIRIMAPDITDDEGILEQMRQQIKMASTLKHKNIASLYGMGKEGDTRYIAMEFVEGQSLKQLVDKKRQTGRTFSLKGAYNVLAHVCNALHAALPTMVHGLPGPGAILINQLGRIKVCDFGLAPTLPAFSAPLARLGDRYCISPEMEHDPSGLVPQSDIYSLGVLLYELLTGSPPTVPFQSASTLIAGIPAEIDEIFARCLNPDPGQRYSDPHQLKAAFYAAIQKPDQQVPMENAPSKQTTSPAPALAPTPVQQAQPSATPARTAAPAPVAPQPAPSAPAPQSITPALAAPTPAPAPAPAPAPQLSMDEMILQADQDHVEKWLIQKDRLDFGPYKLGDLMREMKRGQFSGDDIVLDQENGERTRIRALAELRHFTLLVEKHLEAGRMLKAEQQQHKEDKRRRTFLFSILAITFVILAVGGAVTAYLLTKDPVTREKIVYREKKSDDLIKGIEITWKAEPKEQAQRRRKYSKRRKAKGKKQGKAGDDVTYLGDATEQGGDAILSPAVIQQVMNKNFNKLTPCVYQEVRRTPSLRTVAIDFGIRGSGKVSSVKVNGKVSGPFHACLLARMQRLKFPNFDGNLTRASFSVNIK